MLYPQRRFHLKLELDADSKSSLAAALYEVIASINSGRDNCVNSGVESNWHYRLSEDQEMTSEKYKEAMKHVSGQPNTYIRW